MALDLFFKMMAYYHFLIKQFSCNLNKDRKQVLENIIVVDFPSNVSMKRLECQSKEAQILTLVMLSTWSSLVTQRGSPNQTQNQPQLCLSLTNMEMCTCDFTQVEEQQAQVKKK